MKESLIHYSGKPNCEKLVGANAHKRPSNIAQTK